MRFKTWLENQQDNNRRRKSSMGNKHPKDYNHGKQGNIGPNPRYSGKGGDTYTSRPNNFRTKDQDKTDDNQLR